ncbi:MAG: cysteine hydrolase family protein, partial [Enterococcus sp.]
KLAHALLIIDLQNAVCEEIPEKMYLNDLVDKINHRIELYQADNRPIIFVQHNDEELVANTKAWEIIPGLNTDVGTHFIQKTHANSFFHTNLGEVLNELQVESLEICGAQTEYCVDATVKFAHGLGYQLQMLQSGTATADNPFMTFRETIQFYEGIWNRRFVTFIEE